MAKTKIKKKKKGAEIQLQLKTKESEILKLRLMAIEKERDVYRKELDEIYDSISYRVGRRIAETKIGGLLKNLLRKSF